MYNCKTCGEPLKADRMLVGQWNDICFDCWKYGIFFDLSGFHRKQYNAAKKFGVIDHLLKIDMEEGYL